MITEHSITLSPNTGLSFTNNRGTMVKRFVSKDDFIATKHAIDEYMNDNPGATNPEARVKEYASNNLIRALQKKTYRIFKPDGKIIIRYKNVGVVLAPDERTIITYYKIITTSTLKRRNAYKCVFKEIVNGTYEKRLNNLKKKFDKQYMVGSSILISPEYKARKILYTQYFNNHTLGNY